MQALDFREFTVGQRRERTVRITESALESFIGLTGDRAPVHVDADAARAMGFPGRIAHGLLVASQFSGLLGMELPGPRTVIHSVSLAYVRPVLVDESITYAVEIARLIPSVKTVQLNLSAVNEAGKPVVRGHAQCGMRTAP